MLYLHPNHKPLYQGWTNTHTHTHTHTRMHAHTHTHTTYIYICTSPHETTIANTCFLQTSELDLSEIQEISVKLTMDVMYHCTILHAHAHWHGQSTRSISYTVTMTDHSKGVQSVWQCWNGGTSVWYSKQTYQKLSFQPLHFILAFGMITWCHINLSHREHGLP